MDRDEARRVLTMKLTPYRELSYPELVTKIGNDEHLPCTGPSGTDYQIEIQFVWDDKKDGDVRVLAAIDDGSICGAFRPVCEDFTVRQDGRSYGK